MGTTLPAGTGPDTALGPAAANSSGGDVTSVPLGVTQSDPTKVRSDPGKRTG